MADFVRFSTVVEDPQRVEAMLKDLPRRLENKALKEAVKSVTPMVREAERQQIPVRKVRRKGFRMGKATRRSITESGEQAFRLAGYMKRALRHKLATRNKRLTAASLVQFDVKNNPLLVTYSVGSNYARLKRGNHTYKAGRRRYFYPISVEYGYQHSGGKRVAGSEPLRKGVRIVGQQAAEQMATQLATSVERLWTTNAQQ